jgi:hypothetical protein
LISFHTGRVKLTTELQQRVIALFSDGLKDALHGCDVLAFEPRAPLLYFRQPLFRRKRWISIYFHQAVSFRDQPYSIIAECPCGLQKNASFSKAF